MNDKTALKIYCDESWTGDASKVKRPYRVFYGVLIKEEQEPILLREIDAFKSNRGLIDASGKRVEIKWENVEEEYRNARKGGKRSRHEEFLEVFFKHLKQKTLTFGYMFLPSSDYARVECDFSARQPDNSHNFFFMLYFQFLYHCFLKSQVKSQPCQIFIDNRDMGAPGRTYAVSLLKDVLNKRLYRDAAPKQQMFLSPELRKTLNDSVQLVDLRDSRAEPFVQISDLCAGCVRFILENEMPPPLGQAQLAMFSENLPVQELPNHPGKSQLALYFYRELRAIKGYADIHLLKPSYHYRFNIFPFQFSN